MVPSSRIGALERHCHFLEGVLPVMSGIRKRITAAVAVFGATALFITLGISMSSADEPKAPQPHTAPRPDARPVPFPGGGAFNSADLQRAQDQMLRAMEGLARSPSDAEARKRMDEAQQMLMNALGEFPLPGAGFPNVRAHERARLGVRLEPVPALVSDQLGLQPGTGVAIAGVLDGSAAEKAGFKVHDIVVEFAGKPVDNPMDFGRRVRSAKAGEKVDAVVIRKGKRVELKGIALPAAEVDTPALPMNPKALENGRIGDSVSVSMSGDAFTIKALQDGVNYLITGKANSNGATVEKVNIKAGDEVLDVGGMDKVPGKYRPTVEKLLKLVGAPRPKVRD
jgi:membrane-associated protease RseP (regulator of RpoE activity)